jgi:hypothetical protein
MRNPAFRLISAVRVRAAQCIQFNKSLLDAALLLICLIAIGLALYRMVYPTGSMVPAFARTAAMTDWTDGPWYGKERTLVLALDVTCVWCTASAAFYKQLVRLTPPTTELVAISPRSVGETKKYLQDLGVAIDDVREANFEALDIPGTPTLLLVGQGGRIDARWVGKLSPDRERHVLRAVGALPGPW